jgi:CRP-like cAMP-binding protein
MAGGTGRGIAAAPLLQAQPLFEGVAAAAIARLAAAASRRSLERGATLFRTGDAPMGMYVVVYGSIRLVSHEPRGGQLTGRAGPGQSFGEPMMFLARPAPVDAVAAEDSLVLHLPRDAVLAEMRRDPEFAVRMVGTLSERIEAVMHELARRSAGTARQRLVEYLARNASGTAPHTVVLRATKAAIAAQLLVTPEHLSRLLRELSEKGLLEVQGRHVTITDLERLRAVPARVRGEVWRGPAADPPRARPAARPSLATAATTTR